MPNRRDDDDDRGLYSSPPCFMHEIDQTQAGIPPDATQARDVAHWRKAERERLISARLALPASDRKTQAQRVARDLDAIVPRVAGTIVSLYWPFRGEVDLRPWMDKAHAAGLRIALPIVVAKGQPLVFREWTPNVRLERGIWNILQPADSAQVVPNVVIAPLVGFDPDCYRLGYGGGFFDRTLAASSPRPLVIGVGHEIGAISTIYPQPHDIPMNWIVTGTQAPKQAQRAPA